MKRIPLSQNKYALVSDCDFAKVAKFKWTYMRGKGDGTGYAVRRVGGRKHSKPILMHRFILGLVGSRPLVDHKNRNGIDNRRRNLREATHSTNGFNRRVSVLNSSGYKGVRSYRGKWVAEVRHKGRTKYLGMFESRRAAAKAYDRAATKLHGAFALTNKALGLLKKVRDDL